MKECLGDICVANYSKMKYQKPEMEIIPFVSEGIICASGDTKSGFNYTIDDYSQSTGVFESQFIVP